MSVRSRATRANSRVATRAIGAATAAILGLTTVQVAAPDSTFLPVAGAATQAIFGTTATYDDQNPASVPWATVIQKSPTTRYGNLKLSLDAVNAAGVAKTGPYDKWGSIVPLTIWQTANQTPYRHTFTSSDRPYPFNNSNSIATNLGTWSYVAQSTGFTVTWSPAPGYIGYAPPLPIQKGANITKGDPATATFDYATTDLPRKGTNPLNSSGQMGAAQTAQAPAGFNGITEGLDWGDYLPTYAFQIDRGDAIAAKANIADDQYSTDDSGNYVGFVTTELTTSEGAYTINPDTGEISFTPADGFFSDAEMNDAARTDKTATPIRVIVSNMTTNTVEGDGRVMAYGASRPAHTIDGNNESYAEVNTTYTPKVAKPSVVIRDAAANDQAGRQVKLAPNFAQADGQPAINLGSIELIDASGNNAGRTLTVDGEGTWQVNNDGTVTFTPQFGFLGNPTPVQYTAKNTLGINGRPGADDADNKATLTVTYEVPDGRVATTNGTQGTVQKSTDRNTAEGDLGLTAQRMFAGYPSAWYGNFTYQLVAPDGTLVAKQTAYEVPNVGTYSIDSGTGEVTFTPDPYFTGAAPEVGIRITNLTTANGQQQGEDGSYLPVVNASNVYLQPAFNNGNVGDALTATPDFQPEGFPAINPATIELINAEGRRVGKTLEVPGQGTWTVDEGGTFTFTPQPGFLGNPAPVNYTAKSVDGVAARQASSVTVTYNPLVTRNAITVAEKNQTQRSTDTDTPGDAGLTAAQMFPGLPESWFGNQVQFKLLDASGAPVASDTLTVAGQGTYIIDPATGVVTFTPDPNFLGGAASKQTDGVAIQATGLTSRGSKVNSTLVARYTPVVEDRAYPLPSITEHSPKLGVPWSATPDYQANSIDPATVQILDANGNPAGKSLEVPGQGTWNVGKDGTFTFTPEPGFVGSPAQVSYTANSLTGATADGVGRVTITYPSATTLSASTVGQQGGTQNSTDTGGNNVGRTTAEMFPDLPADWYGADGKPVTFRLLDAQGKPVDNEYTVDGVGTYTLDPVNGTVQFVGDKTFTGQAPEVQIQTVGLRGLDGTAQEMTGTYQPYVTPIRVEIPSAHQRAELIGLPLEITPDYSLDTTVDLASIRMIAPQGATLSEDGKTLIVPGEGTWTVDDAGVFTFTPQGTDAEGGAFVGSPTPITYTATNQQGIPAQVPGQITALYPTPNPQEAVTTDKQGVVQHSDDKGAQDQGLSAKEMFPNLSRATWWDKAQFTLFDASGNEATSVTYNGEGTYAIDEATGRITFTPEPGFTGKAKSVPVGIKDVQGAPKAAYTAVVTPVYVRLPDASVVKNPGETLTVTPKYSDAIDRATVELVAPEGATLSDDKKSVAVPGQGTWKVDENGTFTFTPVDGFYGTPTPVEYTAANTNGVRATDPGTVSGDYRSPKTSPSVTTGEIDQNQNSKSGKEMFPSFPDNWTITYSLPGAVDNTLRTNEGTFTIDPATGVVTFTPEKGYSGTPGPVTVQATTATGARETTTYQVSVTGKVTETATTTSNIFSTATATETATATATETATASPVTTTVEVPTTVDGTPTTVTQTQVVHESPSTVTTEVPTTVEIPTTINGTPTTITETQSVPTTIATTETSTKVIADLALPDAERVVRTPGPVAVTPSYSDDVDRASVRLLTDSGEEVTTLVVPGQGTWNVVDGVFTFTPEDGFTGDPDPIDYTAHGTDGAKAHAPATVSVGYNLPVTETATATERVTDFITATNPAVTTTVTPDAVTVTQDPVTVTPDPVVTTITQVQEPQPVTVTPAPVTVTHDPITTVVTIPGEPSELTTTLTINPEPQTVTPDPVTTTIPGGTEIVPVTVTPDAVTATQEPVTVTPDPVTVTQDVTVTETAEAGTTVEFTPGRARVDTIEDTVVKVVVEDGDVNKQSLTFREVEGGKLSDDHRTLTVEGQGTWHIEDDGHVTFVPEPGFTGELTEVEIDYTRTDDGKVDGPYRISGSYRPREVVPTPPAGTVTETVTQDVTQPAVTETATETSTLAPATTTANAGSSGNETVERCLANAVRSPILWLIPIGLLAAVGGDLVKPYVGQYQAQIDQINAEMNRRWQEQTRDWGFGGRGGQRNEQFEELRRQADAINAQFQQAANRPEVQQLGKVAGGIIGVVALGAVLYDWCSADPGKAATSIDFGNGSSVQDKSSVTRYGGSSEQ